jgi:hypothetical protein
MLLLGLSPLQCREVAEGLDLLETLSAAEFRVLRARQVAAAINAAAAAAIVRAFIAGDMARY